MISSETYTKTEISHEMWLQVNDMKVKAIGLESRRLRKDLNKEEENKLFTYKCFLIGYDIDVEELAELYQQ